jgi:hypothetical protein
VLLVWVYYSAQIFLLGAEFTWVYAHKFGSRRDKDKPATAKDAAATTREPEDDRVSPHDRARRPGAAHTLPARGAPGLASRHTAALTAGAIVLGALAGRLLERTRRT